MAMSRPPGARGLGLRSGLLASIVAGAVHAWALSPWAAAWGAGWPAGLQSVALCALIWLLASSSRPGQAALRAWLYGSVWLIGATGWMYVSLHQFGGLPSWLSALAVYLLCVALSLYLAGAAWVWARWRRHRAMPDAALWAAVWLLAELARAWLFTGFPWGASGYGLVDSPMVVLAPWLGVYGMGAVWAALLAYAVLKSMSLPKRFGLAPACALAVMAWPGAWLGPLHTADIGAPLSVALLQSHVPQDEKFDPHRQLRALHWHADTLLAQQADLVIAPETAIPLLPSQLPQGYWQALTDGFRQGRHALVGVPLGDFEHGYTNSVVGLSAEAALHQPDGFYRYDKHHLVPFGEFIPWGFRWFVAMMNMPLGDFSRGPLRAPAFAVREQRVAPTICYEDLFGEEIAARFVDPAQSPTLLANVSNLAWFGESVAIHQHLQIARLRSLEFQLPTVRSTNTGATVVIDHLGRVRAALAPNTRGVLRAQVQGRAGVTPFAWWAGRWGLLPLALSGLIVVLAAALWPRRLPAPS